MTNEPRYRQDEVREIFERAATASDDRALTPIRDGLTLAELQAIGQDVGIDPGRIAEAAADLELRRGTLPRRTSMGLPVAVGRTVSLPRAPSDDEWDRVVAELRRTFHARGNDNSGGSLRHWSNGNLHAAIEPDDDGWRLRLGTTMGDAAPLNIGGIAALAAGIIIALVLLLATGLSKELLGPIIIGLSGAGILGYNAVRLPTWADEREAQMKHIAARARRILGPDTGDGPQQSILEPPAQDTDDG